MPNPNSDVTTRRFQCRHIFTDGHRCGSPCLRNEDFCYYHHGTRRPRVAAPHDPYNNPPNQATFTLPLPEDRSAIQHSIGQIMNGLANNALDPRRAGLLLYALQIASGNLGPAASVHPDDIVQDVTVDPQQGVLAPKNEMPGDESFREFVEALEQDDEDDDDDEYDDEEDDDYEGYRGPGPRFALRASAAPEAEVSQRTPKHRQGLARSARTSASPAHHSVSLAPIPSSLPQSTLGRRSGSTAARSVQSGGLPARSQRQHSAGPA